MRHRMIAMSVVVSAMPALLKAGIAVEQIESYEIDTGDNTNSPTRYSPVNFNASSTVTVQAGQLGGLFTGITFHALDGTTNTNSNHAYAVGDSFYGDGSVAYPFVSDVYDAPDTLLLTTIADAQSTTGVAAAPGTFAGGAVVVNNSYVYTTGSAASDLDLQRRLDFMIAQENVTFVAAAVSNTGSTDYDVPWSCFNSLAVTGGQQAFSPTGSQGKQHADLMVSGLASFSTATVSSDAAALYGTAQGAGQTDALHDVVIRSLLMAGADKTSYVRQTANNLDISEGAGIADYTSSLAILNGGEKPLVTVGSGGAIIGNASDDQRGWTEGTVAANSQDVVLFMADNALTGLTASLNWDVTQSQPASGQINTSSGATIFADLGLQVRPVTFTNGSYVLGASLSDTTFQSNATGDNVQYLYSTDSLPAGEYAFVITGDASLSTVIGFSYALAGTFPGAFQASSGGSWNTSSNWAGGVIPNTPGAQATFTGATGVASATLTLDGNQTIGKLFLSGSTNYTIAPGTGGTLTINDTGDSPVDPLINVSSGNHTISAPVALTNGVTASIAAASSLTITGAITGSGGIIKTGDGTLTLSGISNFGNTTINDGTVTLAPTANLSGGTITVNAAGVLNIAASTGNGILVHALGSAISVAAGGVVTVAIPTIAADRQLLLAPDISFAGGTGSWTGELNLGTNDLDLSNASLATITNQIKEGLTGSAEQGITSSAVASDTTYLTTLGVIVNHNNAGQILYGSSTTLGHFDGSNPGVDDVLVKYTYVGDANLDGTVNSADYALINNGFTSHLTGWYNGDFNYDGVVDGSDYTLLDNSYNSQEIANPLALSTEQIAAGEIALVTAVPEPRNFTILMLPPMIAIISRRRRRSVSGNLC